MSKYQITSQRLMEIIDELNKYLNREANEKTVRNVRDFLTAAWWDDKDHQRWLDEGDTGDIVDNVVFSMFDTGRLRIRIR